MGQPAKGEPTADSLRVCRDEIQHEYTILSNRLSSYITSQSFLATGYAISLGNANSFWGSVFRTVVPTTLCLLGIVLSIRAMPGISGACRVIELWHERQNDLLAVGDLDDYSVMRNPEYRRVQKRSLAFSKAAVWAFGVGWVVFLGLAIWIATASPPATRYR